MKSRFKSLLPFFFKIVLLNFGLFLQTSIPSSQKLSIRFLFDFSWFIYQISTLQFYKFSKARGFGCCKIMFFFILFFREVLIISTLIWCLFLLYWSLRFLIFFFCVNSHCFSFFVNRTGFWTNVSKW